MPPVAFFRPAWRGSAAWKSPNSRYFTAIEHPAASGPDRTGPAARLGQRIRLAASIGCSGLPSTLIGRNASLLTSTGSRRWGRDGRGKVHRLAQDQVFRLLDVGIDRLIRLLGAASQSGQRQRRAHHLQEAAPRYRIDPLGRPGAGTPRCITSWNAGVSASSSEASPEASSRLAVELAPGPRQASSGSPARALSAMRFAHSPGDVRLLHSMSFPASSLIGGMSRSWSTPAACGCGTAAVRYLPSASWLVNFG